LPVICFFGKLKQLAMTVTLDNFGRILIPKKARQLLQLNPGSSLKLEIQEDRSATLTALPEQKPPVLTVDEYGIPTFVFDTDEVMTYDFVEALRKDREQRGL
jgi:AbrB family looped-hinge helix DNA binding protein